MRKVQRPLGIGSGIQSATFQRSGVASLSQKLWNDVLIKYWERGGPFEVTTMFHTQKYFCPYRDLSKYFFAKSKTNKIVKCPDKTLFATKIET